MTPPNLSFCLKSRIRLNDDSSDEIGVQELCTRLKNSVTSELAPLARFRESRFSDAGIKCFR